MVLRTKRIAKQKPRVRRRVTTKLSRVSQQLAPRQIARPLNTQGMTQTRMILRYGNLDTTGATTATVFNYRINSLFEVDAANPLSRIEKYNEVSGLYQKYRVYGCMVKFNFVNTSAVRAQWAVMGSGQNNGLSTAQDFPSQQVDAFGILDLSGSTSSNLTYSKYYNITDMVSKTAGLSEAMEATAIGSNPDASVFFRFGIKAVANVTIDFQIQLALYAILLDPTAT